VNINIPPGRLKGPPHEPRLESVNLVLMGPPGSGKGTQAARIALTRGVPVIASGDMLRRTARSPTPLGRAVKLLMDRGELIDDEVTIEILSERIILPDARHGFVLDGFPRTVNQGLALDVLMEHRGPVIVVEITVPEEELIRRLSRRMVCQRCGANANPLDGDAASCHCGGALQARADDQETVAHDRLRIYTRATRPLVDFYRKRSTFRMVDGTLAPDRVTALIELAIDTAFDNVSA
jgi:adenylate kinase